MCRAWNGHSSLRFESTSIVVRDAYGDIVSAAPLVAASSAISGLVEEKDKWDFGDIPLSRNVYVCASVGIFSTAI